MSTRLLSDLFKLTQDTLGRPRRVLGCCGALAATLQWHYAAGCPGRVTPLDQLEYPLVDT